MIERSKERVKKTAEVFTPLELCERMVMEIPKEKLKDPSSLYLDNSCGDGNFLVTLLKVLTEEYGHDRNHVVNHQLFGVDLMEDNIREVHRRLGLEYPHPHFVCADSLRYDFSFM